MFAALRARNEDDVLLSSVHIVVLQYEELVHSVLLEGGCLDYGANRTN